MEQPARPTTPPPRRLERSSDRLIGGIAAGLAERWGIDPALVRMIVLLASLLGGLGLVAYGLGWLFLPDSRTGTSAAREILRGRPSVAVPAGLALVVVGLIRPILWLAPWPWGRYWEGYYYSPTREFLTLLSLWTALVLAATVIASAALRRLARHSGSAPSTAFLPAQSTTEADDETRAPAVVAPNAPVGSATAAYPTGVPMPDPQLAATAAANRLSAAAPKQRRPRTPGPGSRLSALIGALALLATGAALLAGGSPLTIDTLLTCLAAVTGALALGVLVSGLRGRRGGWMTGLTGILAPLLALTLFLAWWIPPALLHALPLMPPGTVQRSADAITSLSSWVNVETSAAEQSDILLGAGTVRLAVEADEAIEILVDGGLVDLTGSVFEGWTVDTGRGAEPVPGSDPRDTDYSYYSTYVNQHRGTATFLSPAAVESGPDRTITVTVGIGTVEIYQGAK